jgi:integrin beta 3
MADSPSGVIQRPGGTTGNVLDRTTGRVPRPGRPTPRPADTGQVRPADTGQVRPADTGQVRRPDTSQVRPADTGQVRRPDAGTVWPADAGMVRPADTGQVHRPDTGMVRPTDTGGVRRAAPPNATGRVTGAVPAPVLNVPSELPDEPARTATWVDGRPGTGPVAATAHVAATAVADLPSEEPAAPVPPLTRSGTPGLFQRIRTERGLRVIALVTLSVVVLLLLPLAFGIRAATRDPVVRSLDALDVPGWAAHNVDDRSSGSRWCFLDCRFRERTAQSERSFADTQKAYAAALTAAGWRPWNVSGCPDQPISPKDGRYSCWRRDEFTLDLWVRLPECAVDAVAAQDPAALPSTGPDGAVPTTTDPRKCTGSTVSIKVQNAITDQRGRPGGEKPGLTGETPDPVLSDDPLLEPTPVPS